LIKRSFLQGLLGAIETIRIIEELIEIWPDEVCNRKASYKSIFMKYFAFQSLSSNASIEGTGYWFFTVIAFNT